MRTPSAEMRALARVGQRVGEHYLVEELLGLGAMGSAWAARDERTGEAVVLKVHEEGFDGPEPELSLQRFLREAETLASVRHDNVCRLLASGTDAQTGEAFLVLERLSGMTLAEACGGRPREVGWASRVTAQLARGLEAVHAAGILHRDIKPTNVILDRTSGAVVPKIIDFGLARPLRPRVPVTAGRVAVGTPGYMAPEQCRGLADLDARIDVYALGVTLYEMLTGALPVDGATGMDLMIATVTRGPTSPRAHRADLSPALEALVLTALATDRDARFASASALREAIEGLGRETRVHA
ncbi:MAG: serine/threonine protein kinase [Sandaracinaceae bacterium]|nr:serine/threonine protein kinase [Sandaracinaceae bacterium]